MSHGCFRLVAVTAEYEAIPLGSQADAPSLRGQAKLPPSETTRTT